jgi:hypothetical protein
MKQQFKIFGFLVYAFIIITPCALAQLPGRAPDVLPGTIPEMRDPSFWIARMEKPDEIILPISEIQSMNKAYRKKIQAPDPFKDVKEERKSKLLHYFPGIALIVPDLESLKPEAVSDSVKEKITVEIEYLRKSEYGNSNDVKYAGWEIDELEKEMAYDRVKDKIAVRNGIAVRTTRLKNVPAFSPERIGMTKSGSRSRWDLWSIGVLKIGKPVKVLHSSLSGEFVFVLCEIGWGWVRSDDIAFGKKEEIDNFVNDEEFVVCTGDRVLFYSDESCTYASGWFRMADRLPLVSRNNPRLVKAPVRKMNGEFATETAWLAGDADVHVGLLPYTRRNIVETALKLLDNPYDFTGTFFGRQHETTYRDIFGCFGFDLPYHGGLFTHYGTNEEVLPPEIGSEEQYRRILEHEPFTTIMITLQDRGGHAQLLIGEYNGVPIVFDQHGYSYKDEEGNDLIIRRCCIDEITMPAYFLKRKLTFLELK